MVLPILSRECPTCPDVKRMADESACLLATRDSSLIDAVAATALALGTVVTVVGEREELRGAWQGAAVRLVGVDMVARAAEMVGGDGRTWVVGQPDASLLAASAELGAPALALPQSSLRLAEVLTRGNDPEPSATVVAFYGGSGGVGTSSVTVAAALMAARRDVAVAAIEFADCGGGLDLLMGLETARGVRWGELGDASGELGRLDELLPTNDGVSVLGMGREAVTRPTRPAVAAVLRSLGRSKELILVDAGLGQRLDWLGVVQPVVVVAAHVRGVAAARMAAQEHGPARAQLLVRTGPGAALPPSAVADALGLPLLGTLRHDRAVPRLAATGAGIVSSPARRYRRDVNALLDGLLA